MVMHRPHREAHLLGLHDDVQNGIVTLGIGDDTLSPSSEGQAYTNVVGSFQRLADWVTFQAHMIISDLGTLTAGDAARLMGFPFTFRALADSEPVFVVAGASLAVPVAGQNVVARGVVNTTYAELLLWDNVAGVTPLLVSELSVGGNLHVSGSYRREPT